MTVGELVVSIIGDMRELSNTFSQVGNEIDKIGEKFSKIGKSLSSAGSDLTKGVTAPILAAGAAIATVSKDAVEFEKGMAQVYTLLPNASKSSMAAMSQDVKDFAKEMGVTTTDVVPALYDAIGSGVPETTVFDFLLTAQKAAVGGNTELQVSVNALTSVINAYGAENLSAAEASDIFFTGINVGKMTFEELNRSLYEVVPTAASLNITLSDVTAALATMTAQGTPTTVATAQLRQLFVELSKEGSGAAETFERIAGVSFPQYIKQGGTLQGAIELLNKGMLENVEGAEEMQKAMFELADPTSGLAMEFESLTGKTFKQFRQEGGSVSEALQILGLDFSTTDARIADMFGSVEAGNAVMQLSGPGAKLFAQNIDEMGKSAGATEEAYKKMSDTTAFALEEIKSELEVVSIELGEKFIPIIRNTLIPLIKNTLLPALISFAEFIGKVAEGFNKLPKPVQYTVLAVIAFAAALGPVLVAIGAVVSAVGTIVTAFGAGGTLAVAFTAAKAAVAGIVASLGTLAAPILAIIAVVALLYVAWTNNWLGIRDVAARIWDYLKASIPKVADSFRTAKDNIIASLSTLKEQSGRAWQSILNLVDSFKTGVSNVFTAIKTAVVNFYNYWVSQWNNVKTATTEAKTNVTNRIQELSTNIKNKFNEIKASVLSFYNDWVSRWNNVKQTISEAKTNIVTTINNLKTDIVNRFNNIKSELNTFLTNWKNKWNEMLTSLKQKTADIVTEIKSVPGKIKNLASSWYNAGKDIVQKLIDGLKAKLQDVKNTVNEILNVSKLTDNSTVKSVKSAGNTVINSISDTGKKAKVSLTEASKGLRRLLPSSPAKEGPFKKLPNWDAVLLDPLMSSINDIRGLSTPLSSALSNLRNPLDSLSGGYGKVATVSNVSNIAGDTLNIGPNSFSSQVDIQALIDEINRYAANRKRARG